jgi:tetratricopeptide (TPR) repeat protein/predicted Ser/Thr protein kinase
LEHRVDDSSDQDTEAAPPETAVLGKRSDPRAARTERQSWSGTPRYEVLRLMGEGGMGAVYEAFDREAQRCIAVKTLLQTNPTSVFRFKQEFRTLADVHHPNLVQLHEFVATAEGDVFFTMELVRGVALHKYVRDEHGPDEGRLRRTLGQLVEGVSALHAAGKLHRDIKPSNVLVTEAGRVVILDFGVAAELRAPSDSLHAEIVGTAPFMAPELLYMVAPHPAADWYSVGVVLYLLLTGSYPFVGPLREVMAEKNAADAVSPSQRAAGVPPDLEALCMALLERVPEKRPLGPEILLRLRATPGATPLAPKASNALVGRETHLRVLHEALAATSGGRNLAVLVAGLSGMGKSALIRQFLDTYEQQALVLRGRAYERESVPFKAVDAAVDALSTYLTNAAKQAVPIPLPDDIGLVTKVFPVLGRVPGVTAASHDTVVEPMNLRRRAFVALRALIAAAAGHRPLIVYVDDAQWGDADSAALLLELLRPPAEFKLLLIASYRPHEAQSSVFLQELRARLPGDVDLRELQVGPLSPDDAERLAWQLLGAEQRSRAAALSVARESGGSPFLVEELASSFIHSPHVDAAQRVAVMPNITLERMVDERLQKLPKDARQLLEVIAVEGRPVPVSLAASAVECEARSDELTRLLRSYRFIRGGLRDGQEVVELSHDKIRETLAAQISAPRTRAYHAQLARVFEPDSDANPEPMVVHLYGAGEIERAAKFAEAAAEQAASKLAFDRAARLFRKATATAPVASEEGRRLRLRLAQMLEWAGRGTEAANVYEELAQVAPANQRTALERAAAEHLLTCGRIDQGVAILYRVLSDVGLRAPRTALRAIAWLVLYRIWLGARGLGFRGRGADELREAERLRLDALFTVAIGFGSVDVVLSACMTARYLVSALRSGERDAITRAASLQMSLVSAEGGVEGRHALALQSTARRLVDENPSPDALAFFRSNIGISHYCRGRWNAAVDELDAVLRAFPAHRAGMTSNVNVFCVCSLVYAGRIRELRRRLPRLIMEAEDRGDLFMLAHMRASHPIVAWLAADEPDEASRQARDGIAPWPRVRFVIQHWQAMLAEAQIALYTGDGDLAYERIQSDATALRRSLLLQAQIIRGLTHFVRGRAAVASGAASPALREQRLREATRLARRLGREGMDWTTLLSCMLHASLANARGDNAAAIEALRAAIDLSQRAEMPMHGAAAEWQLGALLGGEAGAAHVAAAQAAMQAEDIRAPARWANMLVPGRWGT